MLLCRFHIDTPLTVEFAIARIRAITQGPPRFIESIRRSFRQRNPEDPPFLGKIENQSFLLRRDIRYHISFRPLIWGSAHPEIMGIDMGQAYEGGVNEA
jgi:hypothetical protein